MKTNTSSTMDPKLWEDLKQEVEQRSLNVWDVSTARDESVLGHQKVQLA